MATILLPTLLRPDAAGAASVEVAGSTVGEAFDALFTAHPALRPRVLDRAGRFHRHLLVFHGDRRLPRGDWAAVPLAPGDSLRLLMAVGGGATTCAGVACADAPAWPPSPAAKGTSAAST
jgi:molybdopterin converting factor small subunit